MKAVLKKWGNGTAVRLPAPLLQEAGFREHQAVQIVVASGKIVISRPPRPPKYKLSELLARVTNKNKHAAVEIRPMRNEFL